ncbi:TPA: hypothetical protein U1B14_002056 [Streptococcus suis]|uniref:hypothetical protein n=1 Tax=Streptococcus suis TaxID=1307 RepID=UPI00209AA73E|nr:hypothetical protein [Streptococcus suis]MCO8207875.1 hypothetical protein [Streptococcus suis]MCO8212436.1 hypothetical protein [Streptococcus suis]HEM3492629.1 hypothetical protein [Streptococcus suis]HEM3494920.1 hypothetical protein [Streptococcus suis]
MKKIVKLLIYISCLLFLAACSANGEKGFLKYVASENSSFKSVENPKYVDAYVFYKKIDNDKMDSSDFVNFNLDIADVIKQGIKTDKDVIFVYAQPSDLFPDKKEGIVFFKKDNFNELVEKNAFNTRETYLEADAWKMMDDFEQYASPTERFSSEEDENSVFSIDLLYTRK